MNVNLIVRRVRSHARHSGYDRLADYLDARIVPVKNPETLGERALIRAFRFLVTRSGCVNYHRDGLLAEMRAGMSWLHRRGQIYHFLYGENSYRYLANLKFADRNNKVLATYHVPPDKFRRTTRRDSHIRRADGIVVVSTTQIPFFSEMAGPDRVFYVPHGVDAEYFVPGPEGVGAADKFRCLFVGMHLRDFDTLAEAAKILAVAAPDIELVVVTAERNHHFFQGMANVDLHGRISDEDLLRMYQTSHVFVLPMIESTANNVLLEAMACGLPIVATDLQGVRDYVNGECTILTPRGNAGELADAIKQVFNAGSRYEQMRAASRAKALEFRWEEVARRITKVYETVAAA